MTEFAIVAPMLLFLLLGILDASLLMFSSGTTRFAAANAARVGSEMGDRPNSDSVMLDAIKTSGLSTSLYTLSWVEIRKQVLVGDTLNDTVNVDHYDYSGSAFGPCNPCSWAPGGGARNIFFGTSDFMKVTLSWTYAWKSGALLGQPPVSVLTVYSIRLEPQETAP
jgi:Flp pilus assembly protein TadG